MTSRNAIARACALVVATLAVSPPATGLAEEAPPPPAEVGIFSFVVENDVVSNTDRHYTNGIRLSYITPENGEPPWMRRGIDWLPPFDEADDLRFEFALGQSMFTPRNIGNPNPDPSDRPYAGWLYGAAGVIGETGQRLDRLQLSLGVVGPASLADETQTFWHEVIGATKPRGWDEQLKNEPAVQTTFQSNWRALTSGSFLGFATDATPHLGGALGNVFIYANTGLTIRAGQNLPDDYGPPRIEPGLPGSGFFKPTNSFGWYVFGGVDGRAVARNIFLDGNTLRPSREVDKKPFVGDVQAGFAVTLENLRFAYTHVVRTKEFDGQPERDSFGAFSLSLRF